MLVLIARRWSIGVVMLAGSALLAVVFAMPPLRVATSVGGTLSTWTTWQLAIAFASILVLEHALREWGALRRMTAGVLGIVRDERLAMAALPALIGFLPSAGGARFSAPLVDEAAASTDASPTMRSFVNYWFRHVWNYSVPVYAGVVLAAAVASVPLANVIAANLPLTVAALAMGAVVTFPSVHVGARTVSTRGIGAHASDLLPALLPIVAVVVAVLVFRIDLALSLVTVTVAVVVVAHVPIAEVVRLVRSRPTLRLLGMVVGVLVFKDLLAASGAVETIPALVAGGGVPPIAVAFVLPFVVGFVTALETAFVGLTFPLLLAIAGKPDLSLLAFAYAAGFTGVMLSPLHLCMVFTREYFETEYLPLLAPVAVATTGVLAVGLVIALR